MSAVVETRPLRADDAPVLTELVRANRDFLGPWEPSRSEDYFTEKGQLAIIGQLHASQELGITLPHVILVDGEPAGRITLNGIVRGAFESCSVGYWVASEVNGRGVATQALRLMLRVAFDELGLHRVQAETLLHNVASQKVLHRNGFERIGMAPNYLRIAGEWQDHYLFQVLSGFRT